MAFGLPIPETDVLERLESGADLNGAASALVDYFRRTPWNLAFRDKARWRAAILKLLAGPRALQQDLAARLGRLLREVGTPSDVAALDRDYASGKELNEGLRLATLEASSATSVLHRALTHAEPSIAVKESALRRLSELGESGTLRDVLRDTTQSATVRISTLQELGRVAAKPAIWKNSSTWARSST
jgi:hypothetical protein